MGNRNENTYTNHTSDTSEILQINASLTSNLAQVYDGTMFGNWVHGMSEASSLIPAQYLNGGPNAWPDNAQFAKGIVTTLSILHTPFWQLLCTGLHDDYTSIVNTMFWTNTTGPPVLIQGADTPANDTIYAFVTNVRPGFQGAGKAVSNKRKLKRKEGIRSVDIEQYLSNNSIF